MNADTYREFTDDERKKIEELFGKPKTLKAKELDPEQEIVMFERKVTNEELRERRRQQFGK